MAVHEVIIYDDRNDNKKESDEMMQKLVVCYDTFLWCWKERIMCRTRMSDAVTPFNSRENNFKVFPRDAHAFVQLSLPWTNPLICCIWMSTASLSLGSISEKIYCRWPWSVMSQNNKSTVHWPEMQLQCDGKYHCSHGGETTLRESYVSLLCLYWNTCKMSLLYFKIRWKDKIHFFLCST